MSGRGRARRVAARLSPRDLAVLASLRELRLMSGQQLYRLHYAEGHPATGARKARAALNRLTKLGLVVRLRRRVGGVRAGSEGFTFGLSGLGFAVLDLDRPTPRRHRRVVETKPAFAHHALAVSELRVQLAEFVRAVQGVRLEFSAEPRCWRTFPGVSGQSITLKADAFVRLELERDGYELSMFVEVDMATESLPTIARKLDVFTAYWRSGIEQVRHGMFPKTWWLVPDAARLVAITQTIARLPAESQALFAVCLTHEAVTHLTEVPTEGGAL